MMYSYLILVFVLFLASVRDLKTMTIPLYLWPVPIMAHAGIILGTYKDPGQLVIPLVSLIITLGVFIPVSYATSLGGGDALLFGSIAFILKIYTLYAVLFSFFLCLPYVSYLAVKKIRKPYPFVPFIFLGTLMTIILNNLG